MKDQTAQLCKVLKSSIRTLGMSLREVERRLEMSRGYLTRLFAGEMDLKVDHVIEIAGAICVEPEEIFRLAFPPAKAEPTYAVARLRDAFGATAPPPPAQQVPSVIEQEIEQIVNRALGKVFSRIND